MSAMCCVPDTVQDNDADIRYIDHEPHPCPKTWSLWEGQKIQIGKCSKDHWRRQTLPRQGTGSVSLDEVIFEENLKEIHPAERKIRALLARKMDDAYSNNWKRQETWEGQQVGSG